MTKPDTVKYDGLRAMREAQYSQGVSVPVVGCEGCRRRDREIAALKAQLAALERNAVTVGVTPVTVEGVTGVTGAAERMRRMRARRKGKA